MAIEIKVPELPESVADGTIATWHVKEGDTVSRDQNLVDIETDKVVLEVVAESDGVVGKISAQEGDTVKSQEVIGSIEEGEGGSDKKAKSDDSDKKDDADKKDKDAKKDDGDKKASEKKDEKKSNSSEGSSEASGETIEVTVPELPESVSEATIATWHVKAGEKVTRDQNLVDIETDKVVLEVVAEADGVLAEIIHDEGANVGAKEVIGKITKGGSPSVTPSDSDDDADDADSDDSSDSDKNSDAVSPSVRRLLAEHDLSASSVKGTGKDGRITKEDVEKHVKSAGEKKSESKSESKPASSQPAVSGDRTQKRVAMTRLRKTIAKRLLEAKNSTAMLTTFNEVNMKPIMDLRKTYQKEFEDRHGIRLGFMSFYVKAVVEALKRFPEVNASIDGDDIVYHNYFDVSIAVSTPRGLVTPVLRDCDKLSLAEIEQGIRDLAIKGRDGKLTLDEMQGGNFTITNGGVFGSLLSTPILNPPQSAILGMHKIQDRPMAVDGKVEILPMMYLALSYDHRIVDGKESVGFLVTVKNLLEDPQRLLLDI
ncbi:2-oxoglutarate dehydrogenase complex dihydrolipoyllysine-residue succinyltransferase [Aliidiomarina halalkaliphila]|uniref:Dihydrolipoyllysine-residue succinyltransferase component of 2-oxoglutarate dehydrogenase complex n=1 Tax=Aliidiomarina halalkaliphila TaxID=2593535 RepID=A0A552X3A4_9GAMM|nr:2-oxoglutarate dehydrogenase complex dihydrolipoyllysine-residue succinyltransferase [Aliidiomarina halalkaliphila]TRW49524.1 2-oxoglutarate dehydrogenase complex dihydrolipoyllysine-residue succinyltransferase [Aliidiomarina halalkaliphila]